MAKNSITIDVIVNGKMEKATVSAKKLKKALDGTTRSQEQLNNSTRQGYRAAQGTAQNTANGTKAFAKQAGVVGGLVPLYATFAANVFAVSAAFGVLSRNAAIQQLETSLDSIGISAGKNLPLVAQNLKAITGEAISTEAALRATAVATTSGFSTSQLQNLTKVATGASIALGRNLPDALDRLVRGTAKLEPEILDELGIIVRLDQATGEYAAQLGKTAGELTQFERQQAFLNATIEQGLNKYQKIAAAVDPNPYDQLGAAFDDLSKTVLGFANTALTPLVKFLSSSDFALFGALALFGTTITSQILPAISDMSAKSTQEFARAAKAAKQSAAKITTDYAKEAKNVQVLDFMPKSFKEASTDIIKGTKDLSVYKNAIKNLTISETRRKNEIEKLKLAQKDLSGFQLKASKEFLKTKEAEVAAIQRQIQVTQNLQAIQQRGGAVPAVASLGPGNLQAAQTRAVNDRRRAVAARLESKGLTRIQNASGPLGAIQAFISIIPSFIRNTAEAEGAAGKLKLGFSSLGSVGKLAGATFTRLIPVIGQLSLAFSILSPLLEKVFGKSEVEKAVDKAANSFGNITKVVIAFKKEMITTDNSVERTYRSLEVMAGITDQTAGALANLQTEVEKIQTDQLDDLIDKMLSARNKLDAMADPQDMIGVFATPDAAIGSMNAYYGAISDLESANKGIEDVIDSFGKLENIEIAKILIRKLAVLESSGALEVFPRLKNQYEELIAEFLKNPEALSSIEDATKSFDKLGEPFKRLESATKSANEAFSNFDAEVAKLAAKDRTPFSAAIREAQAAQIEIKDVITQLKNAPDTPISITVQGLEERIPDIEKRAKFLVEKVGIPSIPVQFLPFINVKSLGADLLVQLQEEYNTKLKETEDRLVQAQGIEKQRAAELKNINRIASLGPGFVQDQINAENILRQAKITTLEKQIEMNKALAKTDEDAAARNLELQAQLNALQAEGPRTLEENYRIEVDRINAKKELLSVTQKELDVLKEANSIAKERIDLELKQAERARSRNRFGGGRVEQRESLKDQIQATEQELERREAFIKQEQEAKALNLKLEYMLLDAKYEYLASEAQAAKEKAIKEDENADVSGYNSVIARTEKMRKALGASALNFSEEGKIVGETTGILEGALKNMGDRGSLELDKLRDKVVDLKTELLDLDPISLALDSVADSLQSGLGSTITDIIDGTKSAKEAFGDLAISVLESFRKVLIDEVTSQFFQMLKGQTGEGGFLSFLGPLFTRNSVEGTGTTVDPIANAGYSSESIDSLINETASPGFGATVTSDVSSGTFGGLGIGGGLDGQGLGVTIPLLVRVAPGGEGIGGGPAIPGALGGAEGSEGGFGGGITGEGNPTKENTKAIEGLTVETARSALNTASMVTGTLAMVAGLTGNEKAMQALAIVTGALQAINAAMLLFEQKDAIVNFFKGLMAENTNTAAVGALTTAVIANTAAQAVPLRTGGVVSNGAKLKGYSSGGVAKGNQTGYPVLLHGTEAVVPLPNGRSIPVELSGGGGNSMQNNNVNVSVVMSDTETSSTSTSDSQDAEDLGKRISIVVQQELANQKRAGGLLSPYGVS